eukprot:scaffold188130_cov18-Tisochrysis_lutea.AAC.1
MESCVQHHCSDAPPPFALLRPLCMQLKAGHTIFVRYASRVFFSDLATEAIKVDDLKWVVQ